MSVLSLIFAYLAGVVTVFIWAFVKGVAVLEQRAKEAEKDKDKENNS